MHSINRRQSVAVRLALGPDLDRLSYAVPLSAWGCHRAHLGLKARALRVLAVFAALNRSGEIGYRGVRATLGAFASCVARCWAGEPSSPDTVRRALSELVAAGFLLRGTYGGGAPRQLVPRDGGDPYWIRDQHAVYTLTARALALWSWSKEYAEERAEERRRLAVCDSVSGVANCGGDNKAESLSKERIPTGAGAGASSSSCVLASSAVSGVRPTHEATAAPSRVEVSGLRPTPSTAPPARSEGVRRRTEKPGRLARALAGCGSVPAVARREIEAALVVELSEAGRVGRLAVGAAALALADPSSWERSPLPWSYWVNRWGSMSWAERRHLVRSEIRPALLQEHKARGALYEKASRAGDGAGGVVVLRSDGGGASGNKGKVEGFDGCTLGEAVAAYPELAEKLERLLGRKLKKGVDNG